MVLIRTVIEFMVWFNQLFNWQENHGMHKTYVSISVFFRCVMLLHGWTQGALHMLPGHMHVVKRNLHLAYTGQGNVVNKTTQGTQYICLNALSYSLVQIYFSLLCTCVLEKKYCTVRSITSHLKVLATIFISVCIILGRKTGYTSTRFRARNQQFDVESLKTLDHSRPRI